MSSGGYAKVFESILDSSIWSEPEPTRLVWITMLAMADAHGFVEAAVSGLARRANVRRDACEAALLTLLSPDPDSKNPENEGRRIAKVDGGWVILNHKTYRDKKGGSPDSSAERTRRYREKQTAANGNGDAGDASQPSQTVTDRHSDEATVTNRHSASASASASGSKKEEQVDSAPPSTTVRRVVPCNFHESLDMPIQERAALALERPDVADWCCAHMWPEVVEAAQLMAEAMGLRQPKLAPAGRDKAVRALLTLCAAGYSPDDFREAAELAKASEFMQGLRSLEKISPTVMRQLLDGAASAQASLQSGSILSP